MKIKVRQMNNASRPLIVMRNDSTGDPSRDDVTEDFKRHPEKYEVIESSAGRTTFTESARKVRVTFDPSKDSRHKERYAKELKLHEADVARAKKALETAKPLSESERKDFRKRAADAFRLLGLTEVEAAIAADQDSDALEDAWAVVTGSRESARIARRIK